MKKSKNLLKNGTDKSYKLNCSLFNFDYTKLLKMIDLLCGKKNKKRRNSCKPFYCELFRI